MGSGNHTFKCYMRWREKTSGLWESENCNWPVSLKLGATKGRAALEEEYSTASLPWLTKATGTCKWGYRPSGSQKQGIGPEGEDDRSAHSILLATVLGSRVVMFSKNLFSWSEAQDHVWWFGSFFLLWFWRWKHVALKAAGSILWQLGKSARIKMNLWKVDEESKKFSQCETLNQNNTDYFICWWWHNRLLTLTSHR